MINRVRTTTIAVALLGACAACGSSTPAPRASGSGSPHGSHSSASGGTTPPTTVPDGLVIGKLASRDRVLTRVEDDGGFGQSGTFVSQARALTKDGTQLQLALTSYASPADANNAYLQTVAAQAGNAPLSGAGQRAASAGQSVYVLQASQVLQVTASFSPAAEKRLEQAKAQGKALSPALLAAPARNAAAAARAVGNSLPGTAVGDAAAAADVPSGALDPCVPVTSLDRADTASHVASEHAPALQCAYQLGSAGSLNVETLTDAQARSQLVPSSARDAFASLPAPTGVPSAPSSSGDVEVRNLSVPDDMDLAVYINARHGFFVEIYEEPTGSFTPEDKCEEYIRFVLDGILKEAGVDPLSPGFAQEYNDALEKLTADCHNATGN